MKARQGLPLTTATLDSLNFLFLTIYCRYMASNLSCFFSRSKLLQNDIQVLSYFVAFTCREKWKTKRLLISGDSKEIQESFSSWKYLEIKNPQRPDLMETRKIKLMNLKHNVTKNFKSFWTVKPMRYKQKVIQNSKSRHIDCLSVKLKPRWVFDDIDF